MAEAYTASLYIFGEQCFSIREAILSGAWGQGQHNNTASLSFQAQGCGFVTRVWFGWLAMMGYSKQGLFEFVKCWLLICD